MKPYYRLVIADDDDEIRNGLFAYFPWNSLGFEAVFQAENGRQALEYILHNPVDVLLCDIRMPIMTGLELAQELHRLGLKPYIILLSAYQEFSYAQQAISSGVHGYMIKTMKYDELTSIFTELKKSLDAREALEHKSERGEEMPAVVQSVIRYVEQNYASATLEDAARMVFLSPFHLSKLFHQSTGVTFSSYLLQTKMERAAKCLRSNQYKNYEVSELVGYTNPKNFSRAFKAYYGITPNDYRNGAEATLRREEP